MNDTNWMDIPEKLRADGFAVFYQRISYESSDPLWLAQAQREGETWKGMGKDLESAFLELEEQTQMPGVC